MNCICVSSEGYRDLLPGFHFLWNRYVGLPIQVVMTGERKRWCPDLLSVLQTLNDDPILIALDDYWIFAPTDTGHLKRLLNEVQNGAQKADLQGQVNYFPHDIEPTGTLRAKPSAQYRTSLQAAIWERQYLLKKLGNSTDPWSFELQDNDFDGARIVGLDTPTLLYANIVNKGNVMDYEVERIRHDDWKDMLAAGVIPERVRRLRRSP